MVFLPSEGVRTAQNTRMTVSRGAGLGTSQIDALVLSPEAWGVWHPDADERAVWTEATRQPRDRWVDVLDALEHEPLLLRLHRANPGELGDALINAASLAGARWDGLGRDGTPVWQALMDREHRLDAPARAARLAVALRSEMAPDAAAADREPRMGRPRL